MGEAIEIIGDRLAASGLHYGHGVDSPRDEAAWLVSSVLNLPVDGQGIRPDPPVDADDWLRIQQLATRRINSREPLAYLLGEAWFCGLRMTINREVIVPRSPLAELISQRFRPWLTHAPARVLDLCTGSGCIAIATAVAFPEAEVDAVDISSAALAVAAQNVHDHGLGSRVRVIQSDLFAALGSSQYDLIISNPPYVSTAEMQALPEEYLQEPELALAAGDDGLDLALRILDQGADHLNPGGQLFLEVGESDDRLQQQLPGLPLIWLDLEHGGEGVCCIDRQTLCDHAQALARAAQRGQAE